MTDNGLKRMAIDHLSPGSGEIKNHNHDWICDLFDLFDMVDGAAGSSRAVKDSNWSDDDRAAMPTCNVERARIPGKTDATGIRA